MSIEDRKNGFKPSHFEELDAEFIHSVAKQYYSRFKFNITHLGDRPFGHKKLYGVINNPDPTKTPDHPWEHYIFRRQTEKELSLLNWQDTRGIGVALGYSKLRAIDVDNCAFSDEISDIKEEIINRCLISLGLPIDYEWVIESGSKKGFHILFYAEDNNKLFDSETCKLSNIESPSYNHIAFGPSFAYHNFTANNIIQRRKYAGEINGLVFSEPQKIKDIKMRVDKTIKRDLNTMYKLEWVKKKDLVRIKHITKDENKKYFYGWSTSSAGGDVLLSEDKCKLGFERIELIWEGHLVLPPSLHKSNNEYKFIHTTDGSFPKDKPEYVELKNIDKLINKISVPKRIYTSLTHPNHILGLH